MFYTHPAGGQVLQTVSVFCWQLWNTSQCVAAYYT